jgi:6,7-dimethyl-8-ribityllumazine synthase
MKIVEGQISSAGLRFAIVAGRFNAFIVDRLVEGALDTIKRTGGREDAVTVYRAPGAFEIPQVLRQVVARGGVDAVLCLGAVIRGGTPHFEYVANAVTRGIGTIAQDAPMPVSFGILTCDTLEQAIERAGTKAGNKGGEAAMAAIEMACLFRAMAEGD